MATIGFGDESVTDVSADQAAPAVGFNNCGRAAGGNNNCCAALLPIAGHDLRQPLQIIIGAHDMHAKTVDGYAERRQLARAEIAASKLNDTLDQLVEALRLFDPSSDARQELVSLRPILTLLDAELSEAARRKGGHRSAELYRVVSIHSFDGRRYSHSYESRKSGSGLLVSAMSATSLITPRPLTQSI